MPAYFYLYPVGGSVTVMSAPETVGKATFAEMAVISMAEDSPILIDVTADLEGEMVTTGLGFVLMLPNDRVASRHKLLSEIKYMLSAKLSEFYEI